MRSSTITRRALASFLPFAILGCASLAHAQSNDKVPITTSSTEARELYLQARDLAEKLRATDAHRLYEQAVQKDPHFAMAWVGLANTSGTNKEFIDNVTRAAALADAVSPGEQHVIRGIEAAMKGDPAGTLTHYTELVRLFPADERALTLLGNTYFGRQEYDAAIENFTKAIAINPSFSQPYNQLGYAYRTVERFDDAEKAFKKYTELIPDDPNPYDSYAEFLMKVGRFGESIKMYEKALSLDRNFIASYIGIGNDYLAMGKPDQARAAFAKINSVARNTGERRLAHFWTAASYVHEGATDKAIQELRAGYALADAEHDAASMSADLVQMGDVLREAGRPKDALAKYQEAVTVIEKAQVPDELKAATRRGHVFEVARVAVAQNDLRTAKARAAEFARQVTPTKRPFEVRQQHELAGLIALAEKQYGTATKELQLANQQDPRILYAIALAKQGAGDTQGAVQWGTKAAKFNGLSFDYAYVRTKAQKLSGT